MFLNKIKSGKTGFLLYGITPPKLTLSEEKVKEAAQRTLERLFPLDIDALIIYDVQDESARTSEERPFPFSSALDPFYYASQYLHDLNIPKIIYRPVGKFTHSELQKWLEDLYQYNCYPVFVGVPAPDFQVKTSLNEAYDLWKKREAASVVGAIMIPERHAVLKDEDQRILNKVSSGVSFFVSQCVFDIEYTQSLIDAIVHTCNTNLRPVPTLIFTLTACGSVKTLQFMNWLGIHIPESLKNELLNCKDILTHSIEISLRIAAEIIIFCSARNISFGFNIESVAIKKEEIDASILLVKRIGEMLKESGLRSESMITSNNNL